MSIEPKTNVCIHCQKPFTSENVFTDDGWRETNISGMCERCFDAICRDCEDDEDE